MISEVTDKSHLFSQVLKEVSSHAEEMEYRAAVARLQSGAKLAKACEHRIDLMHMETRFKNASQLAQCRDSVY